ncbi:hypothetical protein [Lysinibacillus sp.]|nr:hypothetical protein [Lysinibacillus sp.]
MYAVEQIKEYLKPAGWMTTKNLKKEIVENEGVAVLGRFSPRHREIAF